MLGAVVELRKQVYNHPDYPLLTGGTAIASVAAIPTVSRIPTTGKYYIKAKGRGKYWYRSKRLKGSYENGTYKAVSKIATRHDKKPTWSGVHLRGEAKINNQFDDVAVDLEWL